MKKIIIFLMAFWISFMAIYSIYYYKVTRKLDESVVADAKDLPNTVIGYTAGADTAKNMILTMGIGQAVGKPDTVQAKYLGNVPDADFVAFNTAYTKANLEKFYEGLESKFPNHPPILFKDVKDGDKVVMSYYFENLRLPEGFRVSAQTVPFKDKNVRALQYHMTSHPDTSIHFYKADTKGLFALKVPVNGGKEEVVFFNDPQNLPWQKALQAADSLTNQKQDRYSLKKDESVLVPELDFNFVKDLKAGSNMHTSVPAGTVLTEERIKLKLSAPKEGGPLEVNESYNTAKNFIMNGNVLYFIRETGKTNPYCIVYLRNPEILKVVKDKSGK